jgi:hypothetical protein
MIESMKKINMQQIIDRYNNAIVWIPLPYFTHIH